MFFIKKINKSNLIENKLAGLNKQCNMTKISHDYKSMKYIWNVKESPMQSSFKFNKGSNTQKNFSFFDRFKSKTSAYSNSLSSLIVYNKREFYTVREYLSFSLDPVKAIRNDLCGEIKFVPYNWKYLGYNNYTRAFSTARYSRNLSIDANKYKYQKELEKRLPKEYLLGRYSGMDDRERVRIDYISRLRDLQDIEEEHENRYSDIDSPLEHHKKIINRLKSFYEHGIRGGHIDLSLRNIDDDMIPEICEWIIKLDGKFQFLNFDKNKITSKGAIILFDSLKNYKSTFGTIWMQDNLLDDECLTSLGEYIQNNKAIQYVRIGENNLSDKGIEILSEYIIGNRTLKYLGIGGNNRISDKSTPTLFKIIQSSNIEGMNIKKTSLSQKNDLIFHILRNKLRNGTDKINLSGGWAGDDDIIRLCESINAFGCDKLREIDICYNKLTSKGASVLFNTLKDHNANVIRLNLTGNQIDDQGIAALGGYIKNNKSIERIWVGSNNLTDKGMSELSTYLNGNKTVKYLGVSFNSGITDKSVPFISKAIESSIVEDFYINGTSITKKNAFVVPLTINIMKNGSFQMDIRESDVTDDDIFRICETINIFGCEKLIEIELFNNKISSKGATKLFNVLQKSNSKVFKIDLRSNDINDECMDALGMFIQNNRFIECVYIGNNKLTNKGIKTLAQYLKGNKNLKYLGISFCKDITDDSVSLISDIVLNSHITFISVNSTSISEVNQQELKKLVKLPIKERKIPA